MSVRITESRLRRIIREEMDDMEDMEGAAPPRSALGRWAFADQRDSVPPEPNKPNEQALFDSIVNHFIGSPLLQKKECDMIQGFLKKGIYEDVFMEPEVSVVYRGLNLTLEDFNATFPFSKWYDNTPVGKLKKNEKPRVIQPLSGQWASSWSTAELGMPDDAESVVWNFATGNTVNGRVGPVGVVLVATIAANRYKFLDCAPLYELEGMPDTEDEEEAIGMGPINIAGMYLLKLE